VRRSAQCRNMNAGPSLECATHALKSRYAEDRLRAIAELERIGAPTATPWLVEALRDRLSYVGASAARALVKQASPEIADAMIDHFFWASKDGEHRDAGCAVRIELAIALGNMAYLKADEALRLGLRTVQIEMVGMGPADTAIPLRGSCALALAQIRPPGALLDISLLLFEAGLDAPFGADALPAGRAAAKAIGVLGDPAGNVPLALMLRLHPNADADIIVESMNSLVSLADPRAMEFLIPYLDSENRFLAGGAALAMGRTRNPAALPPLIDRLEKAPRELAAALAAAIATLRLPEARAALLAKTSHQVATIRAACVEALALFPDQEVKDRLKTVAEKDRDARVRLAAANALGLESKLPEKELRQ